MNFLKSEKDSVREVIGSVLFVKCYGEGKVAKKTGSELFFGLEITGREREIEFKVSWKDVIEVLLSKEGGKKLQGKMRGKGTVLAI